MGKKITKKFKIIFICILELIIIFPLFNPYLGLVFAKETDERKNLPSDLTIIPQTDFATYGYEDRSDWNPTSNQYKIYEIWKNQGKKADQNGWAYISADTDRKLIALAPTFGQVGDYINLYIKNGDSVKTIPCIMAEAKGKDEPNELNDGAYYYNGIHVGHKAKGQDKCNILEIQIKDDSITVSNEFVRSLVPIKDIKNGESYFDHPEGPVGLTSNSSSYSNNSQQSEETFGSVVLSLFRTFTTFLATAFDNSISGREDSDNMYFTHDPASAYGATDTNQNITVGDVNLMITCRRLSRYLMSKGAHYGWPYENLTYNDLEENFRDPDYNVVCATYVAIALWQSGILPLDFINRHSYNAADGIATMVQEAGWKNMGKTSDRREGDILVQPGTHAAISAGGLKVWEESTGVISTDGSAPTGEVHTHSEGYLSQFNVYRKE